MLHCICLHAKSANTWVCFNWNHTYTKNIYTWRANGIYVCLIESHDGVTGEFRANRTIKELTESWIGFNVAGYH